MRILAALVLLLSAAAPALAQPNAASQAPELIPVANPGFPYLDKSVAAPRCAAFRLKMVEGKKNEIIDQEAWKEAVGYNPANKFLAPGADELPAEGTYGKLKFYRALPDGFRLAIYESSAARAGAAEEKGFGSVYDRDFGYVALVLDADKSVLKAYDLGAFFPGVLEMSNIEVVDKTLYFDANYNGYAEIAKNKTGYLIALDVFKGKVLWTTPALTASFWGFVVIQDRIVAGYGFTDEPDFLYVVNRHTGAIEQKQKLKSAHETLFLKGNRLYVRTYNMDYVFEF